MAQSFAVSTTPSIAPPDELRSNSRYRATPSDTDQVGATNGGTDGSDFVRYGVLHVSLSWPGRYSHSPVEVLDLRDLQALDDSFTPLLRAVISDRLTRFSKITQGLNLVYPVNLVNPLRLCAFLLSLCLFPLQASAQRDLTRYVNPFIGTAGHGHTFPGAIVPFGMVQLSPDTRLTGWDGCSGYHYSDSIIYGFSHTHLSGTGISDYGDILLMPTVEIRPTRLHRAFPASK